MVNKNGNNRNGNGRGRPPKYQDDYPAIAASMCRRGATQEELAARFKIHPDTIKDWKNRYPEFAEAVNEGKEKTDGGVESALLRRALGYEYEETETTIKDGVIIKQKVIKKQVNPDVTAQIFWLKNRRPDIWRDVQRQEMSGPDGTPLKISGEIIIYQLPDNNRGDSGTSGPQD